MNTKKNNESQTRRWIFLFLGLFGVNGLTALPVSAAPFAYVTNNTSRSVSVIDTATSNTVVDTVAVPVGTRPYGVAVAPDGKRVYVGNHFLRSEFEPSGSSVSVIDTTTTPNTVVDTVVLDDTSQGVAVAPDGKRVYVANWLGSNEAAGGSVLAIDTTITPNSVVDIVTVGYFPQEVAVAPDGKRVYVTNLGGYVSVIDTTTTPKSVVDTVAVGDQPYGMAVAPDGKRVYVGNMDHNTVSVIDTTTTPNTVVDNVAVGDHPWGVAVAPDGKRIYVANWFSDSVSVIDTTTTPNTVVDTVAVGYFPSGVAVAPNGKRVYVTNQESNSVSVIDTTTTPNTVVDTVAVGGRPIGVAISPLSSRTKFSAFNVNTLTIRKRQGNLFMLSNFVLGKVNNGINPTNEAITLKVGNVTMTIPADSFRKNRLGLFTFDGRINNKWIKALIMPLGRNRFGFEAEAYGADLDRIKNPVTVELTIGNDSGITSVKAIIQK